MSNQESALEALVARAFHPAPQDLTSNEEMSPAETESCSAGTRARLHASWRFSSATGIPRVQWIGDKA
jgi:hypothetical protein